MCLAECWDKANSMQKSLRIFAWINILRKKIRLGPPLASQYSRLGSLSGGQFLCAYSLPLPCWWSVNFWSSEDTTGERSALFLSRVMKILCYLILIFTYSNSLLSSSLWCLLYPPDFWNPLLKNQQGCQDQVCVARTCQYQITQTSEKSSLGSNPELE